MDIVLVQKFLTHLAYPIGFIGLMLALILVCRILYLNESAKKCTWLAIFTFILSSNSYIANSLVKSLESKFPQFSVSATPNADAIIVLGGSLAPPSAPRNFSQLTSSSNRFWLAAELFKAGKSKHIILTGGNVFKQTNIDAESVYIRQKLIAMGVPKEAIIIETSSRTTRENATNTNIILQKLNAKSALLVTSAIHMPRSIQLFSILNVNIIPIPSDIIVAQESKPIFLQLIPNSNAIELTTKALHEYYGIWAEKLSRIINNL